MSMLHRKLWRDGRVLWSQAVTIALVVASGLGGFITSLSAVDALAVARSQYYAHARFAEVFAEVERAPQTILEPLRAVPGVAEVQPTIEKLVRIELAGTDDPIVGRLIGLSLQPTGGLNQVSVLQGRPLSPTPETPGSGAELPVLVSAGFARARGLTPGARVHALINGKQRTLVIQGLALSPEYVFAGLTGMPDLRGFGVFWIDETALAAAWDLRGAFNRVAVRLAPQADEAAVIAALDRILGRFGGRNAYGRTEHVSHTMLDNEIREQRVIGTILPAIFVAVAAVLLNVVVTRLIATQREQIAALAALGYSSRAIAIHYVQGVGAIVTLGLMGGLGLGKVLGSRLTALYGEFFQFPHLSHQIPAWLIFSSLAIACATTLLGALSAVRRVLRLAPAEAMQPAAPRRYRTLCFEHYLPKALGPSARMMLRHMARRPWRTSVSVAGVAAAMAIVIMGTFVRDAIDHIEATVFGVALRADVMVWLTVAQDDSVQHALARLPGVIMLDPGRDVLVRLVHGHRTHRIMLQGWPSTPQVRQIVDVDQHTVVPHGPGLLMTDRLAAKLGLQVGDPVRIEVLEGRRPSQVLYLNQTVREMMGLNVYVPRAVLDRILGESPRATRYALALERGSEGAFLAAANQIPGLAGVFSKATLARNMRAVSSRNVRIMSTVMTSFAIVIAVGVIYNDACVALAERAWELASLRVLGMTRGEVSSLLLGELGVRLIMALPLGMAAGVLLVHGVAELLRSDQFFFPIVIRARTHALAALTVLSAGTISALIVRRRIDQLDLVAVLKVRA